MPLVTALRNDPLLQPFLKNSCAERGMAATISPGIDSDDIVIISPDDYFNSAIGHARHEVDGHLPKSPDCLVVVRCHDGTFSIFIVELRDIKNREGFRTKDIQEKFRTCLHDFMQDVLGAHFIDTDYRLNEVKLLFVSDPYGQRSSPENQEQYTRSPKLDVFLGLRPFHFDGRKLGIDHRVHDPLIRPC